MEKNKPIVFYDSGIGGLPYLALAREKLPQENYIYLADKKNYPLGDKSVSQIKEVVKQSFKLINSVFKPKAAVVACNTASVAALAMLRKNFSFPFIGVVPAIKPAAHLSKTKRIGVLATPQTTQNDYLEKLINEHASDCLVYRIPAPRLRDYIENDYFSPNSALKNEVINESVNEIKKASVDVVVLGCTHYLFVQSELEEALGSDVKVIDSREGVIKQFERVLWEKDFLNFNGGRALFFTTAPVKLEKYQLAFCQLFNLEPGGNLK